MIFINVVLTAEKRGRHFPDLILRAQLNLKDIFGMELVGLRAKEGVKSELNRSFQISINVFLLLI